MVIPNPDITFHPFAGGGVLHRAGSHRLWVLNVTAAVLWCLMDGQTEARALCRDYGRRFGIDEAAARQDVEALLSRFAAWGLLNGGSPPPKQTRREAQPLEALRVMKRLDADISGLPRVAFSLAGRCFAVTFDNEDLAGWWQPFACHLACAEKLFGPRTELAVLREDGQEQTLFICYEDGKCTGGGLTRDEVIPFLVYKLFEQGMAALPHRLLFHAAVVARDGRALLLPAQSGSGKSTLAAALAASGWDVLSDELAVIDPQTLAVEPFALPIGLKDKSMAALGPFIPGVADLPRHTRMDRVGIRYQAPPQPPPRNPLPVAGLIFPCYGDGAPTTLEALAPLEALQRLAATGSSARPLVSADVRAMLKLASLPAHALAFSDLKAAIREIEKKNLAF